METPPLGNDGDSHGPKRKFKTQLEFAEELGLTYITFHRKFGKLNYVCPSGLLSLATQDEIRVLLKCN